MSNALIGCPFCGAKAVLVRRAMAVNPEVFMHVVAHCTGCGASLEVHAGDRLYLSDKEWEKAEEIARERWNRRCAGIDTGM